MPLHNDFGRPQMAKALHAGIAAKERGEDVKAFFEAFELTPADYERCERERESARARPAAPAHPATHPHLDTDMDTDMDMVAAGGLVSAWPRR